MPGKLRHADDVPWTVLGPNRLANTMSQISILGTYGKKQLAHNYASLFWAVKGLYVDA